MESKFSSIQITKEFKKILKEEKEDKESYEDYIKKLMIKLKNLE